MTLFTLFGIITALIGMGWYIVRVGKKIAKLDRAEDVIDAVSKIHKMGKEEDEKTHEAIKNNVSSGNNSISDSFPRVQSPYIRRRRGARNVSDL